nr:hypothetical protein [Mucilaginibacter sp. FT3.2]
MSDSEFHSCVRGGEAGGGMEPGAIARGVMKPPAAAAWPQLILNILSNNKDNSSFT